MTPSDHHPIFVVDDDEDDQFLLQQVLNQHTPDSAVQVLQDGEELLAALAQDKPLPSLILLDLNMPRMGGLEALRHIRTDHSYDRLAIVILTTSDSDCDRQQASALRATDYLVKPGTVEQMDHLISTVKRQWL